MFPNCPGFEVPVFEALYSRVLERTAPHGHVSLRTSRLGVEAGSTSRPRVWVARTHYHRQCRSKSLKIKNAVHGWTDRRNFGTFFVELCVHDFVCGVQARTFLPTDSFPNAIRSQTSNVHHGEQPEQTRQTNGAVRSVSRREPHATRHTT